MKRYLAGDRDNYDPLKSRIPRADPELRSLCGSVEHALAAADDLAIAPPPARNRRGAGCPEFPNGHCNTPKVVLRLLRSRAGRPWNEVWREICQAYPAGHKVRELVEDEIEHGHVSKCGTITIPGRFYCSVLTPPHVFDTLVVDQHGVLRHFPRTLGRRSCRRPRPHTAIRVGKLCVVCRETGYYQFDPKLVDRSMVDFGAHIPGLPDNCRPGARAAALAAMGYERFFDQDGAEFYVLRRALRRLSRENLKRLQARSGLPASAWVLLAPPSIARGRGLWFSR